LVGLIEKIGYGIDAPSEQVSAVRAPTNHKEGERGFELYPLILVPKGGENYWQGIGNIFRSCPCDAVHHL